jgi:hypothetical protein
MAQTDNRCDTSQAEYQSSPPKHLFLRIMAVTLLVVAVRVAVTAAMTTGLGDTSTPGTTEQARAVDDHAAKPDRWASAPAPRATR